MSISKRSAKNIGLATLLSVSAFSISGEVLAAGQFDSGIPAGWTSQGNTGTSGADGVVTLAPSGGSQYGWVSTAAGVSGVGLGIGSEFDGSTLTSSLFSATAGDNLHFSFNFVTSDGAGYADYAWSRLLDSSFNEVALLFTARAAPSGNSVPGFGLPAIAATTTPATVPIIPGGPNWLPLGGDSGKCFGTGCGYTGWVQSDYAIAAGGNYFLEFGVVNWADTKYDSGLAFDSITVGGNPLGEDNGNPNIESAFFVRAVPEPASLALLGIGLAGLSAMRRRKQASEP